MQTAMAQGHVAEAAQIHFGLVPLFKALFATSSPIPVKWAMNQLGFRAGATRLPLGSMPDALKPAVTQAIERYKESAVPA